MKYSEIIDNEIVLYHGTCESSALHFVKNGWEPYSGSTGSNMEQSKYLYLTKRFEILP